MFKWKKFLISLIFLLSIFEISNTHALNIEKVWASDEINEKVKYAFEIWLEDKRFIGTLEAENSSWSIDRRSNTWYMRKWKKYYDYWFCQISEYYHPKIVHDPKFFTDWKWQIRVCYVLYQKWTKFYGMSKWKQTIKRFKFY